MTPQEKELITALLDRLKQAGGQPKDPEADALIRKAVAEQPDAPYYLVQTVLIQDMALGQAQARLAELEKQLAEATQKQSQPGSFLGGLFGGAGAARPAGGAGTVPSAGPWGRAPAAQPQPPQYAPQQQPGQPWGQPGYGQPGFGGQPMMGGMGGMGGGGFLRSAAATAAGIAGGALLFQGISSMFGHGALSGVPQQAGLTENITNNYYGTEADAGGAAQTAAWDPGAAPAPGGGDDLQYAADQDYAADPGADYAADDGGFGGDDSDLA
jgi:hypothetical protein